MNSANAAASITGPAVASLEWAPYAFAEKRPAADVQLALLRQAVDSHPQDAWLRSQLSAALLDADCKEAALAEARAAAAIDPANVELRWRLVQGLLHGARSDQGAEALVLLDTLPEDVPEREREFHRGCAFELSGQPAQALECHLRFLQQAPSSGHALYHAVRLLLALDRAREALELLDSLQAQGVCTTRLLAERVTLLRLLEQHPQANRLEGLDQFLRVIDMSRRGVDPRLNAAILADLVKHPGRRFDNPRKRTRGGWRIDSLDIAACAALRLLFASIQAAIAQYIREVQAYSAHPFMRLCPSRANISAWALWMSNDAHQEWHIHPDGWLSGVYYVQVPDFTEAPPVAGALVIGTPELADHCTDGRPIPGFCRWHQPGAGELVLIPAHCYHRTLPTRSATERICIAFDVVPAPAR
jgi:tetratricopeptide (TPR) repeat protein